MPRIGRFAEPEEIADATVFLNADAAYCYEVDWRRTQGSVCGPVRNRTAFQVRIRYTLTPQAIERDPDVLFAECCHRVARRISRTVCSPGVGSLVDFWLTFTPSSLR